MTARNSLLRQQRQRIRRLGHAADRRGYLPSVDANLRAPLSAQARIAFANAGGADLVELVGRPAKMRALHSSSALVANVFDFWSERDPALLAQALQLNSPISSLGFEAPLPTGLEGRAPATDVALTLGDGTTVAIESKFTEWLVRKSPSQKALKPKYFPPTGALWDRCGLPGCQQLATAIAAREARYRFLNANQLLKHSLGLAMQCGHRFSLVYLYFDWPRAAAAEVHRAEIVRFAATVGPELRFRSLTYQELFARLRAGAPSGDAAYLAYLGARYFDR